MKQTDDLANALTIVEKARPSQYFMIHKEEDGDYIVSSRFADIENLFLFWSAIGRMLHKQAGELAEGASDLMTRH